MRKLEIVIHQRWQRLIRENQIHKDHLESVIYMENHVVSHHERASIILPNRVQDNSADVCFSKTTTDGQDMRDHRLGAYRHT